jgi:5-methylcytosine-specific restriction endonuclease McrA
MTDEQAAEYRRVLASKHWRALKKRLRPKDNACARCGKIGYELALHHKTYVRLGHERDDDVEFLCPWCHAKADDERAAEGRRRSANALYAAQLEGWGRKVYGDGWEYVDYDEACERFDQWVEEKETSR